MGVPKFFRYMSERYPCLNELVKEFQLPDFDNLYLDMNGIIHACSHPNDFNPHFTISEEKIFASIFHYIEVLFNMIKPRKLFFLAVDGVAPRAKMNQQRARRFRTAKEAELRRKQALEENGKIEPGESFDSNCITPGTVFMDHLHSQLKYFITSKVSNDPMWQNCKIILSGHQTPGEGEHKIMDYIRYLKTLPDYDVNTKHCFYGLDADLIMLGLCTHEPHFTLLREKVLFTKHQNKRIVSPDEIEFYLLHLSLLRDYLDLEFQELKETLPFDYNLQNIVDDWILMGFLVGNDFIPNLPDMHINKGALPIMYAAYKEVLPSLDGYLNENGYLNLPRFQKFMERLGKHDLDTFEDTYANLNFLEEKMAKNFLSEEKPDKDIRRKADLEALIKSTEEMLEISDEEVPFEENDDIEDNDTFLLEFNQHKKNYYTTKLDYSNVTEEVLQSQAEGYIRAIQWNLHYYYQGCQSWSWYYPHHYSPYISDIKNFKDLKLDFEMGKPFLPFEQLLAVLPPSSKDLLPAAYQPLMTSPNSPIKDFYPEDFETDLNGKTHEWEAVVLIPFIDEKRLLEAMEKCTDKLTPEERERNQHGPMLVYTYTEENLGFYKSPGYFPNLVSNHASVKHVFKEEIAVEKSQLNYRLRPNVLLDVLHLGFPTLKHIPYKAALKCSEVKVFQARSSGSNMILTLLKREFPPIKDLAEDILGKIVYVQWPHLVESRAAAVCDGMTKFSLSQDGKIQLENLQDKAQAQWRNECQELANTYKTRLGVEIGQVNVIVYVQLIEGRKYTFGSTDKLTLEKVWSEHLMPHALNTIVKDVPVCGRSYDSYLEFAEAYPLNSTVFMLGQPHFGSIGRILDSSKCWKYGQVKVALETVNDPVIGNSLLKDQSKTSYFSYKVAALKVGINPRLLSRITGAVLISMTKEEGPGSNGSKINIGLNLKFFKKNEEIPGYTKKENDYWLYSMKAVNVISQYVEKFSRVVEYLSDNWDYSIFVHDIFPGSEGMAEMKDMVEWIKNQEYHKIEKVKCGTQIVENELVAKIEELVENFPKESVKRTIQVKPHHLYKSDLVLGIIPPVFSAQHFLLDRVVSIRSSYTVPAGLRGFIIAIHPSTEKMDYMYDVLFDESFVGASKGASATSEKTFRMSWASFINISDAQRKSQRKTLKKTNVIGVADPFGPPKLQPSTNWNNSKNSAFAQWFQPPVQPPLTEVNKEFQKMWTSLMQPQEEPTSALKKILKIQDRQNTPTGKEFEDPVKSFFEKVTKVPRDMPPTPSNIVPLTCENKTQNSSKYSNQLFSYCQKKNLGQPRFKFIRQGPNVVAQVKFSDGRMYTGVPCDDKESACESAALQAWGALGEASCRPEASMQKKSDKRPVTSQPLLPNTYKITPVDSSRGKHMKPQQVCRPNCQVPPVLPTPPPNWVGLSGHQGKRQWYPREYRPNYQFQHHPNPNQHPSRTHQSSALEFVPLQAIAGKINFNNRSTFHGSSKGQFTPQKRSQETPKKPQQVPANSLHNWAAPPSGQPKRRPKIAANLGLDQNLC